MQSFPEKDRKYRILGFRIIGEFGASIAVPVVVFAILGKSLDKKFATSPKMLIIGFVVAFVISAIIVYRKAKYFGKLYKDIENYDSADNSRRNILHK